MSYYEKNREHVIAKSRQWRLNNYERFKEHVRRSHRKRYYSVPRPGKTPKRDKTGDCRFCGSPVSQAPSAIRRGRGKYCSSRCYRLARKPTPNQSCKTCGKPFHAKQQQIAKGQGTTCSLRCRSQRDPTKAAISRRRASAKRRAKTYGAVNEVVDFEYIKRRDKMRCHICRKKVGLSELHFDHVIPLAKGGSHTAANIAVSHARCNLKKRATITKLF